MTKDSSLRKSATGPALLLNHNIAPLLECPGRHKPHENLAVVQPTSKSTLVPSSAFFASHQEIWAPYPIQGHVYIRAPYENDIWRQALTPARQLTPHSANPSQQSPVLFPLASATFLFYQPCTYPRISQLGAKSG